VRGRIGFGGGGFPGEKIYVLFQLNLYFFLKILWSATHRVKLVRKICRSSGQFVLAKPKA
jgi:hypothetical protein